ncbi:hypothetical protein M434DRAFT_18000 [Hypoxylon sp. CO27-5]|nr:hypothetical protein M434DRAFT_18000 [Hypoxylon sp. CO27-5]
MSNLLDQKLEEVLYKEAEGLYKTTKNPSAEVSYPIPSSEAASRMYTLRLAHESQLANHIAFLAQSHEGAKYISAACVEEMKGGSVIRLASNETPSEHTRYGLKKILNTMKDGVTEEILFEKEYSSMS